MDMVVVRDFAGKLNMNTKMLFDNLAYLRANGHIILFAQLVENKFELERVVSVFQLKVYFRVQPRNNLHHAIWFMYRAITKLTYNFLFQLFKIKRAKAMANTAKVNSCLLYTSDAADEEDSVDL